MRPLSAPAHDSPFAGIGMLSYASGSAVAPEPTSEAGRPTQLSSASSASIPSSSSAGRAVIAAGQHHHHHHLPSYLHGTTFGEIWEAAYTPLLQPGLGDHHGQRPHYKPAALTRPRAPPSWSAASAVAAILPADACRSTQVTTLRTPAGYNRSQQAFSPVPNSLLSTGAGSPANAMSVLYSTGTCRRDQSAGHKLGPGSVDPPPKLPTTWNAKDKCMLLELAKNGTTVKYIGSGKNDADAASVRANHPIPPQCGIFYYEVEIVSKGRDGFIGIGVCAKTVALNRLPGWEPNSWGYHGDDGHSFCCSGTGRIYGPTFTTGDIVGCCVNFLDGTIFYTKNGANLGTAFRGLPMLTHSGKPALCPAVGMRTPGEVIEVNFGRSPFRFLIDDYFQEQKALLWDQIMARPVPRGTLTCQAAGSVGPSSAAADVAMLDGGALRATVNSLVHSYLASQGYCEATEAFARESCAAGRMRAPSDRRSSFTEMLKDYYSRTGSRDIRIRQRIREAIMAGDVDTAIELTRNHYPRVLEKHDLIHFWLRCRKFVEMILGCSVDGDDWCSLAKGEMSPCLARDDAQEEDIMMDVDDDAYFELPSGTTSGDSRKRVQRERWLSERMREAMEYGQKLQDDYKNDARKEIREALAETFSLLAYPNPANSAVAYLLDPSRREQVAAALNGAILESQGLPPVPLLEMIYRQTKAAVNELTAAGVGAAAFVNMKDCVT